LKRSKNSWDPLIRPLSSDQVKGRMFDILSVALVGMGVAFWVWPIETLTDQAQGYVQGSTVVHSLIYIFLATQLTTIGVAFYAYSLSNRRSVEEHDEIEAAIDRLEGLLVEHKMSRLTTPPTVGIDIGKLRDNVSRHRLSRLHILSVVEAILLVVLYGWLANEYRSNVFMQGWVQSNIPWMTVLLSEYAFYVVTGLVFGALVSQLGFLRPRLMRKRSLIRKETS